MNGGGAIGALFFTLGLMVLFVIMFSTFLILPFFIFIAGIIAMIVSDRRNSSRRKDDDDEDVRDVDDDVEIRVVETRPR